MIYEESMEVNLFEADRRRRVAASKTKSHHRDITENMEKNRTLFTAKRHQENETVGTADERRWTQMESISANTTLDVVLTTQDFLLDPQSHTKGVADPCHEGRAPLQNQW